MSCYDCEFIHKESHRNARAWRAINAPPDIKGVVATVARDVFVSAFMTATPFVAEPRAIASALERTLGAGRVTRGVVLAPYTTFKIGGPADWFFEATAADELADAVGAARSMGLPHFVLGLGANILIGDLGFRGLVVRNAAAHHQFFEDGRLRSESGAVVKDLIQASVRLGWSGLEHYVGIPSTVGGAIWQNLHFLSPAPARERTMFIAE